MFDTTSRTEQRSISIDDKSIKSVIVLSHLLQISKGKTLFFIQSTVSFWYINDDNKSLGNINLVLKTRPRTISIMIHSDLVSADVPTFLDFDIFDKYISRSLT